MKISNKKEVLILTVFLMTCFFIAAVTVDFITGEPVDGHYPSHFGSKNLFVESNLLEPVDGHYPS